MTHADSNYMGSLVQALEHQSSLIGEKTALLQKVRGIWVSLTWSEYIAAVAEVGEGLVELGVGAGDKVVTLLANSTALVCIDIATQSIGAVSVPLVIETRPDEVLRLVAELKPKVIAVQSTSWLDLVLEARSTSLIGIDTKVVFADSAGAHSYVEESLFSYQELRKLGRSRLQETPTRFKKRFAEIDKSMVATCVVSSGSTGVSSIYSFSHSQVVEHPNPLLRSFLCRSVRSSCLSVIMGLLASVQSRSILRYLPAQLSHFLKVKSQPSRLQWRFCHILCIHQFSFCSKLQQKPNADLNRIMV